MKKSSKADYVYVIVETTMGIPYGVHLTESFAKNHLKAVKYESDRLYAAGVADHALKFKLFTVALSY